MSRGFALPRAALLLGVAAATLLTAAVVVVRHFRPHRPNVILIVADTLRADRLGAYGDRRGLTPFLDQLAARGVVFRNAYAASSWTCPSVASLFTSRYPSQHHVTDIDSKLPESELTLAERLGEHRFFTALFSANFRLSKELGYGQGFNLVESLFSEDKVTGDQLADDSFRWLDWAKNGWGHPVFLYYHFMETHSPYDPDRESRDQAEVPLKRRLGIGGDGARATAANDLLTAHRWRELGAADVSLLESLYDAEVALLDFRLRRLFAELERRRLLEHAIVVFTADHGEEFRDHGLLLHGTSLFNELIRVPLILVLPGRQESRVVDENVSLVDVAPTLLDLVGLPAEPRFEGRSLVPFGREHADVLAEYVATSDAGDLARHSLAFVRGSIKLLVPRDGAQPEPILYDLSTDPFESRPDPPELAARKAADQAAAQAVVTAIASRATVAERGEIDERTRARLRALGYAN